MRKTALFILLCVAWSVAATPHITAVGNAMLLPNPQNIDTVYIFENLTSASLETHDNTHKWLRLTDNVEVSNQNYLYPEDNTGYILETEQGRLTFWVLDYSKYKPTLRSLSVNPDFDNFCEQTQLLLDADIPPMSYQNIYGGTQTINRTCRLVYHSLAWNGEVWADSLCVREDQALRTVITINDAPLQNAIFTLYDNQFANELSLSIDSISTELFEAVAVDAHPTTITTTRGSDDPLDLSNEVERPVEDTQLSGSAPLDIYFKANATPAAKYCQWQILKGSDLIAQRTDAEHRYTFDEYGEYRALLWVSNDKQCQIDSVEIKISVATSQLLAPNVFTPNGDGKNDEFRVMYRSITEFHCWVYNRWGHKVFEWTDPAKGWDGTINGKKAASSAYFYVIRAVGADGVKYELKGDINLIRGKSNE